MFIRVKSLENIRFLSGPLFYAVATLDASLHCKLIVDKHLADKHLAHHRATSGYGASNLVIGLAIVAIGANLPELAASITATSNKQHAIAIGVIVGSSHFNKLAVMGIPGLIYPSVIADGVLDRAIPFLIALTKFRL
jgi:Ca2+/Na+ antiporter